MGATTGKPFNTPAILAAEGPGRSILRLAARQFFFSQGDPADAAFYLQTGRAKLTVISKGGKKATATASAVSRCVAMKIDSAEMLRVLHQGHAVSDFFMRFILNRGMRTQADLVDQLFNSSEKRLARTLLLMAKYGEPGPPETLIPPVTQETLAEMIGTTRSRVSFFMNRFR